MPRKQKDRSNENVLKTEPIYRYWVEFRDLQSDSTRSLPLKPMQRIFLSRKKNEPDRPREEFLELRDDSETIEARDVDDLAAKLRCKYPDSRYERTLHSQRDPEAEVRYANALSSLMDLIVESIVRDTVEPGASHESKSRT